MNNWIILVGNYNDVSAIKYVNHITKYKSIIYFKYYKILGWKWNLNNVYLKKKKIISYFNLLKFAHKS